MNHKNNTKPSNPTRIKILRRLGELISDGLFTLVKWNFLFFLTSLPIITIGPSLGALHCCTNALSKDDRPQFKPGKLYFSAFRSCFRQTLPLGLLIIFICTVFGSGGFLYLSMTSENIMYIPLTSISALILILFFGIMIHLFPMLFDFDKIDWETQHVVTKEISLLQLFHEATYYALSHMKATFIVLIFSFVFLGSQIMMLPITLPILVTIGVSFPAMAAGFAHTEPDV